MYYNRCAIKITSFLLSSLLRLYRRTPPYCLWSKAECLFPFFRLETPFLTFFALLYDIMSQLLIHPFYTNRPRFV